MAATHRNLKRRAYRGIEAAWAERERAPAKAAPAAKPIRRWVCCNHADPHKYEQVLALLTTQKCPECDNRCNELVVPLPLPPMVRPERETEEDWSYYGMAPARSQSPGYLDPRRDPRSQLPECPICRSGLRIRRYNMPASRCIEFVAQCDRCDVFSRVVFDDRACRQRPEEVEERIIQQLKDYARKQGIAIAPAGFLCLCRRVLYVSTQPGHPGHYAGTYECGRCHLQALMIFREGTPYHEVQAAVWKALQRDMDSRFRYDPRDVLAYPDKGLPRIDWTPNKKAPK